MAVTKRAAWTTVVVLSAILTGVPSRGADRAASGYDANDQIAQTLLSAMKAQNYSAAFAMFDETMKAAVSVEKLRAVWSAQIGTLGPLTSYTITERTQARGLEVRMARLVFAHGELQAMVAVHPDTHEVAGFVIKPATSAAKSAAPAPYVRPSDFRSTEVSIGAAPYVLGATVTVPVGLGPFPGVVLVHGSGPADRDETVGANKTFKDLAEGLASRGIEVLRYDKRTFAYGSQLGDTISVEDEVMVDAVAAVASLRGRPEIDPQRVFVVGHSLGALLAPEIATRSAPVAGIVLLAPPGRPLWDLLLSQMRYLAAPPEQIAETERKVAQVKAGTLGSERLLGVPQGYWRDVSSRDGVGTAKKLGKPVLILRGDRDFQVLEEDIETWRKGLAGLKGVEIVTLPGLNHLFIAGEGKPGPAEYQKPGHVDGRVIDKLAGFLGSR